MNYELAKKLKDAGFPQKGMDCNWLHNPDTVFNDQYIYAPTLSELIKACGNGFETLHCSGSEYWAGIYNFHDDMWLDTLGKASTAEEAIASLWLKLENK